MISEAMGKILGMAMAYGVSSLGLLLAYVNYRKRIVRAERVMSGIAWAVVGAVLVTLAAGAWVVASLAEPPAPVVAVVAEGPLEPEPALAPPAEPAAPVERSESQWSVVGLVVPGAIFLLATWITAALHRHFTHAPPTAR